MSNEAEEDDVSTEVTGGKAREEEEATHGHVVGTAPEIEVTILTRMGERTLKASCNIAGLANEDLSAVENASGVKVTEEVKANNYFLSLPDEIAVKILSYLSVADIGTRVSLVNRNFSILCMDPGVWTHIVLPTSEKTMSFMTAIQLLNRCPLLKQVRMEDRRDSSYLAMYAFHCCPRLDCLDVKACGSEDELLEVIETKGHALRKLGLWGDLNSNTIVAKVDALKNLTRIVIGGEGLTDAGLKAIGDKCTNLESVEIFYSYGLTENGISHFLEKVQARIKELSLPARQMSDSSFNILQKCQSLEELTFFGGSLQASHFELISLLTNLHYLRLSNSTQLKSKELASSFRNLKWKKLVTFAAKNLPGLDDQSLTALYESIPNMTKLQLIHCHGVSDDGIKDMLSSCKNLSYLQLQQMSNITKGAFVDIQAPLRKLQLDEATADAIGQNFLSNLRGKALPNLVSERTE